MTRQELYETIAAKTGEDLDTIESFGFELHVETFDDRKELRRLRRLKKWRQERRNRHLANIASKIIQP